MDCVFGRVGGDDRSLGAPSLKWYTAGGYPASHDVSMAPPGPLPESMPSVTSLHRHGLEGARASEVDTAQFKYQAPVA